MSTTVYRRTVVQMIASLLVARENCVRSDNQDWLERHNARLVDLIKNHLPSGSGIDRGTRLDYSRSNGTKIVLDTAFHHMDSNGYYDGWTEHGVIVRPTFDDIDISIKGHNKNDIKDYLHDVFRSALLTYVEIDHENDRFFRSAVQP